MIEDLIRQVSNLQRRVDGLVTPEITTDLISPHLALPGLLGFWPMSSIQRSSGNVADLSGHGRTLTYTGNPTFNIYNNLVPYVDLDGTGDYLNRNDETDLDISGTESIFASAAQGLTMGGWFLTNNAGVEAGLIGKYLATGNQRSYLITVGSTPGQARFFVSGNGTAFVSIANTSVTITAGVWYHIVARYAPSTSIILYVNGIPATNTTSIPASIFSSTSNFNIGAFNNGGTGLLDGHATMCFICANRLSGGVIQSLYQQTRGAFKV